MYTAYVHLMATRPLIEANRGNEHTREFLKGGNACTELAVTEFIMFSSHIAFVNYVSNLGTT